jgi:hypothetical protein
MFVDKDGEIFEYTDVYDDGRIIVHHHGNKEFTPGQNEKISKIMSRIWDNMPDHLKEETLKKLKYA